MIVNDVQKRQMFQFHYEFTKLFLCGGKWVVVAIIL
jgi:hypothetical protein